MNKHIVRSLFQDALYQVFDNLGFRILGVLFLLPVLLTFLVGFREDGMWIAHYWHWSYESLLASLSSGASGDPALFNGIRDRLLDQMIAVIVDWIADKAGFVFGIAAISFFVPQMLEKGAADVVFSKPVSRLALFLSRYIAGLIFVGVLSSLLVGGMFLGFFVTSGYRDTGLLWSILTLIYGFAIFHAISCTIGVFTKSTIGAILLTVIFMPVNCGLHKSWELIAVSRHVAAEERERKPDLPAKEPPGMLLSALNTALTAYHVIAPKSRDATRIAQGLRRDIEDFTPEFADEDLGLSVAEPPAGFAREPRSSFNKDGLVWIAAHPDGGGEARWTLKRDALSALGSRTAYVKRLKKELAVDSTRADISRRYTDRFEWKEKRGDEERLRRKWVFQIGDTVLTLDYDAESAWGARDESEHSAQVFLAGVQIKDELERQAQEASYDRYFAWSGPWQFNAWFSVGTTLMFVLAMLGLGWWKLSRTDF
ncbi:MAG: ABC transporter permease [Planctomycetes bacterium]|nr:ABC transporter permease [Planctomycetota bacterium]